MEFLVHEKQGELITGTYKDSEKVTELKIVEPWNQFLPFIEKFDTLSIKTDGNRVDKDGYLVLQPNFMVAVTSVNNAVDCPRKTYVKTMGADDDMTKAQLTRITQGNLLHDTFSMRITSDFDMDEIISTVLKENKHDLISQDIDEKKMRDYLEDDGKMLKNISFKGETELDCENWNYGMHGKFDGVFNNNIVELKSSKIPDTKPWPDHNLQMITYVEMMRERGDYSGKVLYIRDGRMGIKQPTDWDFNQTIIARNYAYLTMSGKYVPPLLRDEAMSACRRCFQKVGCYTLCAGYGTQRDCQSCIHDALCEKKKYEDIAISYAERNNRALFSEEAHILDLDSIFSRGGRNAQEPKEKLIEDGFALRSGKKQLEERIDAHFRTEYIHEAKMSRFRRGDFVKVYDQNDLHDSITLYYNAIVEQIDQEQVVLVSSNALPDQIMVVQSSSTSHTRRGRRTIFRTLTSRNKLIKMIMQSLSERIDLHTIRKRVKLDEQLALMEYNDIQIQAILMALNTPDIALIQGPAGTGKTSVIVEILNQLIARGKRVLCSAFTNMAVDNVGLKLREQGIPFIRLGHEQSMNPILHAHSIAEHEEDYRKILEGEIPGIIISTTSTIAKSQYEQIRFDYAILDEAAQMTEPESLKAILLADRAVLVGDHAQLQPIVVSREANLLGFNISLFERLVDATRNRFILLNEQYRMHDEILQFPNTIFYQGKLKSADKHVASSTLKEFAGGWTTSGPYEVLAIDNLDYDGTNHVNYGECAVVVGLVHDLVSNGLTRDDIGIITPFRAQVAQLRALLPTFRIDTIDRFQGSENKVVILSSVTSLSVPILTDERRINVALTRAKRKLVVLVTNPNPKHQNLFTLLYKDAVVRDRIAFVDHQTLSSLRDESNLLKLRQVIFQILNDPNISQISSLSHMRDIQSGKILENQSVLLYFNSTLMGVQTFHFPENCPVCLKEVKQGIRCEGCDYTYHYDHLLHWLRINSICPVCKHTITIIDN